LTKTTGGGKNGGLKKSNEKKEGKRVALFKFHGERGKKRKGGQRRCPPRKTKKLGKWNRNRPASAREKGTRKTQEKKHKDSTLQLGGRRGRNERIAGGGRLRSRAGGRARKGAAFRSGENLSRKKITLERKGKKEAGHHRTTGQKKGGVGK